MIGALWGTWGRKVAFFSANVLLLGGLEIL
jgi:hypothetical protein